MQFVRQSKFRHIFGKPLRKEASLDGVRISKISWDSQFACVNAKFMAVITEGSGGPFMVFPINKVGRVEKDYPIVDAHKGACLDIAWCPFNDNVIASCSEDCTAKIPDGVQRRSITEPVVELLGHEKRVTNVAWHPVAGNVLLTAGADHKILLWNVSDGEALIEIAGHPDLIWSVAFSWCGSRIVTTCKDKMIRVIDPRSGEIIREGRGHEGMKPMRAIFTKNGQIFTTGFTKRSERQYSLRDEDDIDNPIVQEELDTSNGVIYPLHDYDTGLTFLVGKGDCAIRYYEINDDPPFVHFISTYTSTEPQRGMGFMPKLGLNLHENEIARIYKFTNKGFVEVLPFFVPRKSDLFQDDLYPPTPGPIPALTVEKWLSGVDAEPLLVEVRPKQGPASADHPKRAVVRKQANILASVVGGAQQQQVAQPTQDDTEDAAIAARIQRVQQDIAEKKRLAAAASARLAESQTTAVNPEDDRTDVAPPSGDDRMRWEQRNARLGLSNTPVAAATSSAAAKAAETVAASRAAKAAEAVAASRVAARQQRQDSMTSSVSTLGPSVSRQGSEQPPPSGIVSHKGEAVDWSALVDDVHKMKLIIRKHERRIRYLEEMLSDKYKDDLDI